MAIHVTEQLRTFLLSSLLGLGAGVLYDLLRAVRLRLARVLLRAARCMPGAAGVRPGQADWKN